METDFRFMRSLRTVALAAVVLLVSVASLVNAQVYKCFKDGEVIYQEAPCDGSGQLMDIPLSTQPGGFPEEEEITTTLPDEDDDQPAGLSDEDVRRIVDVLQERVYAEEEAWQEPGPVASCRGIEIHDVVTYDVGGQTFVRRWPYGGYYRKRYISSGRVQCASLEVRLPGYYGRIFGSLDDRFTSRFIAVFVDGTVRSAETLGNLPEGRIDTTARYRIELCFGPSEMPIDYVTCE
ncbi:MAG: hypothetical protein R3179_05350 [Sedimenticolaceae bacterium]|nr:hypothetical protein [Sedimenticolaceae bacterium]